MGRPLSFTCWLNISIDQIYLKRKAWCLPGLLRLHSVWEQIGRVTRSVIFLSEWRLYRLLNNKCAALAGNWTPASHIASENSTTEVTIVLWDLYSVKRWRTMATQWVRTMATQWVNTSIGGSVVEILPAMQEPWVWFPAMQHILHG